MPNRNDKPSPSKRKRSAQSLPSPSARKAPASAASPKAQPKPAQAAKPQAASKGPRTGKFSKAGRSSRIPKVTTTSRLSGAPASKTGSIGKVNRRPAPAQQRQTQAKGGPQRAGKPRSGPQARTTSASNEFVAFTREHPKIMIPVFVVVALLLVYTLVDLSASFGRIHPGVTVQGVDVGGLTTTQAADKLTDELTPQLTSAHVTIYEDAEVAAKDGVIINQDGIQKAYADEPSGSDADDDGTIDMWSVTAETVGAYIDGEALAQQAYLVGREGNFVAQRFFSWFGGTHLAAEPAVHAERFNSLMSEINSHIGLPIEDSTIVISGGKVSVNEGKDGWAVNESDFIKCFGQAAFDPEHPYYVIPMQTQPMHIMPATAQVVADQVQSAISDDVTIVHEPDTWTLNSVDLSDLLSQEVLAPGDVIVIGNGTQKIVNDNTAEPYSRGIAVDPDSGYALQVYVDQHKMDEWLVSILGPLAIGGAENAWFDTSSGEVVLVEAIEGYGPDRSAAELALQDLLFGTPDSQTARSRTITLVDGVIQPAITTEMARSMGITERLASWSIPLSGSSERIHNLKLLCQMIDHSLVAPNETWSFNGTTGERTAEKGFQTAPVIINGRHEDQLGGGICQVATCVFNCACFSGLGIAERVNHDFYIDMYDDEGFNDATVSWKSPDLKWTNDMSTYVLITAVVTDEDVVVTFWGTKDGRTVECQRGEWRTGDKYAQITEVDPEASPDYRSITQHGIDGRAIDIRYLATAADGTVLHDVMFHSIYAPQNEITTVGPQPTPESSPEPASSGDSVSSQNSQNDKPAQQEGDQGQEGD